MMETAPGTEWPRLAAIVAHRRGLVVAAAVFATLAAGASVFSGFHVELNDFWGNLFVASTLSVSEPATWHDGFYPIGYAALLRLAGHHAVTAATMVNLLLWTGVLVAAGLWARRLAGPAAAILAVALVGTEPRLFAHAISAGSDLPALAFVTVGTTLACWRHGDARAYGRFAPCVGTGVLLGVAGLIRYHALVASVAVILGVACASRDGWRAAATMLLGVCGVYGVQVAANVFAGAGPFETSQAFNVYRMTHGIDWFTVSPATAPTSVLAVIRQDPSGVWSAYLWSLREAIPIVALGAVASTRANLSLARDGRTLLVAATFYALVVSFGASSRAWLPLLPLSLTLLAALSVDIITSLSARASGRNRHAVVAAGSVAVLAVGVLWARTDARTVVSRARVHADYRSIETQLFETSDARRPAAVFTSDFDLYFPARYPHTPFRNGGWMRVGTYGYEQAFPAVCTETIECFVRDARLREISHVVLGPTSGRQSSAFGAVYDDPAGSPLLVSVGQRGAWRLYRLAPPR